MLRGLMVVAAGLAWMSAGAAPARAAVQLFAAGSLSEAMRDLIAQSGIAADAVFGPSGVLRQRIEAGAPADILASADLNSPRQLAAERGGLVVNVFARNRLCAFARPSLGLTPSTLLDRMLDPSVRLATSTPGADPGGDYAWQVFARAEAVHPGARAALEHKAMTLVGGPDSKPLVPGQGAVEGVFLSNAADIMLGYCSGADGLRRTLPDLAAVPLPDALAVGPAYGMVVLDAGPEAARFALFVLSERGQAILARHGFLPVAAAE